MTTLDDTKKRLKDIVARAVDRKLHAWRKGIEYDYLEDVAVDALAHIQQLEEQNVKLQEQNTDLSIGLAKQATEVAEIRLQYLKDLKDFIDKAPRWISVKERHPENNEPVLVSAEKQDLNGKVCNVVFTAFHTDGTTYATDGYVIPKAWWEDVHFGDECLMIPYYVKITHWMPLPKSAEVTHESQTN